MFHGFAGDSSPHLTHWWPSNIKVPNLCSAVTGEKFSQYLSEPFPKQQILDSSKMKEFADDNFKLDEYGREFLKRIENTEGKEKLLVTSNFSLSPCVFKRLVLQTRKNQGFFGERVKLFTLL